MLTRESPGARQANLGASEGHDEPTPRVDEAAAAGPSRIADAALAALFATWEPFSRVLLAVSGGPDSVALMLLATRWARQRPEALHLSVATVDHGLRPRSATEAAAVAEWAAALGLAHATLRWEGPKPQTRVQERARQKRYELLLAHAKEIGAEAIATGHHADDQAETILFRLARGSGVTGLAGMAPVGERDGRRILRPLLAHDKAALVATCEAAAHPYFSDPSNADAGYARTRIRDLLAELEPEGLNRRVLLQLGRRAARAEAALVELTRRCSTRLDATRTPDRFVADIRLLAVEPDEIVLRVLAHEIKAINMGRAVRLDRLESLAARLSAALRSGAGLSATLAGVLLELDPGGTLKLRRESARGRSARVRSTLL
jgi:tRNA(Ile)-lysidine synthase